MMTKWPYTMKIKPNTRRKYAKNLYWLRKEIAKRSDTVDDTNDGAADQKHSKPQNTATPPASWPPATKTNRPSALEDVISFGRDSSVPQGRYLAAQAGIAVPQLQ